MINFNGIAIKNEEQIQQNKYPGRGIIIGMTPDEKNYVQIYWIMGRSSNSRNRVFEIEESYVKTKAFVEEKMEDPSLIIYYPIKELNNFHIVSNGDQTDTIYNFIKNGDTFQNALNTREFEPDSPNFTPRISGYIDFGSKKANYGMSIIKSINNNEKYCQRSYYYYTNFINGFGHCIHTYREDGNPITSIDREPFIMKLYDKIEENSEHFWSLLNEENRISLLVKYIDRASRQININVINKNKSV